MLGHAWQMVRHCGEPVSVYKVRLSTTAWTPKPSLAEQAPWRSLLWVFRQLCTLWIRAGVGKATCWLTVNTRAGWQFRTGKTVGSSSFGMAAARQLCAGYPSIGLALPWYLGHMGSRTTGSPRGHSLHGNLSREWLNVQSGRRKGTQPFGVCSGSWFAWFLCVGCRWDLAAARASAYQDSAYGLRPLGPRG